MTMRITARGVALKDRRQANPAGADGLATMTRMVVTVSAAIAGMGLVVGALWALQGSTDIVADWEVSRPGAMIWAIRCGAIASAALAQVVIVGVVAGQLFPRRRGDQAVVISAAAAFVLSVIAGVVLAAIGR